MSTKSITIHLAYLIVICTLIGMLYMQHSYYASQASTASTEQLEAEQALLGMTTKFEKLQADFEALHKQKKPTEQSQFYQDRFRTLEVKHNALKVMCEHHKADLEKCLNQSRPMTNASEESNHPMQQLNRRLEKRKQAALQEKNLDKDATLYEYDDPAKTATPETTKPEQRKVIKPEPQTEPMAELKPETIKPEPQAKPPAELKPEAIKPEIQTKPLVDNPEVIQPASQTKLPVESKPEAIKPKPQALPLVESPKPESIKAEPQVESKPPVEPKPETIKPEPQVEPKSPVEPKPETIKPEPQVESMVEAKPKADTSSARSFQCPSSEVVNKGLATGNFKENDIVWWLDFSFRPLHRNEEVKDAYQTLFSGKYMDCYYNIGPQASEKIIEGIWIVLKGTAKNYTFVPNKHWQDCHFDGCLKMCHKKDNTACTFSLHKN